MSPEAVLTPAGIETMIREACGRSTPLNFKAASTEIAMLAALGNNLTARRVNGPPINKHLRDAWDAAYELKRGIPTLRGAGVHISERFERELASLVVHLGSPPKPGRRSQSRAFAKALFNPTIDVLEKATNNHVRRTPESELVEVIRLLLQAIDGKEHKTDTVHDAIRGLRRRPNRGDII